MPPNKALISAAGIEITPCANGWIVAPTYRRDECRLQELSHVFNDPADLAHFLRLWAVQNKRKRDQRDQ